MTSSRRDSFGTCQIVIGLSRKADAMESATLGKSAGVAFLTATAAPTVRVRIPSRTPCVTRAVGSSFDSRREKAPNARSVGPNGLLFGGEDVQLDQVTGTRGSG